MSSRSYRIFFQALELSVHNIVEKPVDNHVDKLIKCATDTLLDRFAQGLSKIKY